MVEPVSADGAARLHGAIGAANVSERIGGEQMPTGTASAARAAASAGMFRTPQTRQRANDGGAGQGPSGARLPGWAVG
jgi:hypothetical protein